jgi:hypothetical protein
LAMPAIVAQLLCEGSGFSLELRRTQGDPRR